MNSLQKEQMNKKGSMVILLLPLILLLVVILLLNHYDVIEIPDGFKDCRNNCEDLGLEYMSYNTAIFSHSECWCKNESNNETKRIY